MAERNENLKKLRRVLEQQNNRAAISALMISFGVKAGIIGGVLEELNENVAKIGGPVVFDIGFGLDESHFVAQNIMEAIGQVGADQEEELSPTLNLGELTSPVDYERLAEALLALDNSGCSPLALFQNLGRK